MSPGSTDEANCQPPSCRGRCAQVRRFRPATRCRSPAARGRNLPPAEMPCPPTRRPAHEAVSSGTDAHDTHPSTGRRRHVLPSTSGASSSIGSDRRDRVRIAGVRSTRKLGGRTTDYAHRRMSPRGGWVAGDSSCSSGVSIGVTPRNPWTPARGRDRSWPSAPPRPAGPSPIAPPRRTVRASSSATPPREGC